VFLCYCERVHTHVRYPMRNHRCKNIMRSAAACMFAFFSQCRWTTVVPFTTVSVTRCPRCKNE
jgi:hypothetical protein